MLRILADANGLIIRLPGAPEAPAGTIVPVLMLR
jgi:molybdopterin biosynthesis enzyme